MAAIEGADPYQLPANILSGRGIALNSLLIHSLHVDHTQLPPLPNELVEYLVFGRGKKEKEKKSGYTRAEFKAMKSLQAHNHGPAYTVYVSPWQYTYICYMGMSIPTYAVWVGPCPHTYICCIGNSISIYLYI